MSHFRAASIAFLVVTAIVYETECLSCYECSVPRHVEGEPQNLMCFDAPWDIPGSVKTCLPHMKACRIVRMDHKDSGRIHSFVRSCSPPGEDHVEETFNYIIYNAYCFTSKCNKGDGVRSAEGEQNKRMTAILIKDIMNGGHQIPCQFLLLIPPIFTLLFPKILAI